MTNASRPLKIGFVLDDGLDKPDGVQQNILTLGGWLKDQGHEVKYLVGETKRRDIPGVITLSKNLKVNFNGNRLSIPLVSSAKKIKSVLESENFDVIHVQVPYSPVMAARLITRLENKTALLGTFHILPSGPASFWGAHVLGAALSINLKEVDKQLAVSEPARVFAKQSFNIDCEVLPNPVNVDKYKAKKGAGGKSDTVRLVFLGRLVSRKGCGYLVKSIKHMLEHQPPKAKFHLDICGGGALKSKLVSYVKKNNLEMYITFHGFITEQQKIKMLRQADISIFPSISGESFGIVLIEAMASGGGIVIGGDNPGYRSVLGNVPESLMNPLETAEFSKKLSELIDSPQLREDLYKKQQSIVSQYDTRIIGEKLLKIYKDCISAKKSR